MSYINFEYKSVKYHVDKFLHFPAVLGLVKCCMCVFQLHGERLKSFVWSVPPHLRDAAFLILRHAASFSSAAAEVSKHPEF